MDTNHSYIDETGLAIWGCKGGCRTFCADIVDVKEREISNTLKDVRSFVSVRRPGVDYYAVEFTSRFKVFTHYRSSNDSGAGAFIAVSLFVPHALSVTNLREVLDELIARYFREYVNPLNGSPLSEKYDEIKPFRDILRSIARVVPDRRKVNYSTSIQNDIPKIVKYDDLAMLDRYFNNPYYNEFFGCQEVMFFRRELVDNRSAFDITFSREPESIDSFTESLPAYQAMQVRAKGENVSGRQNNAVSVMQVAVNTLKGTWKNVSRLVNTDKERLTMYFTFDGSTQGVLELVEPSGSRYRGILEVAVDADRISLHQSSGCEGSDGIYEPYDFAFVPGTGQDAYGMVMNPHQRNRQIRFNLVRIR